jgi:hypothetical protein
MDPQPKRSSTAFEYFLYAALLTETGLAALIYKVIFRDPELLRLRVYFAIFYFAFLAWGIEQLNMLHRERNPPASPVQDAEPAPMRQAMASEITRPVLGLTIPQLVTVLVVFATAIATFSCALRLMH